MPQTFARPRVTFHISRLRLGIALGLLLVAMITAGASYADALTGSEPAPLSTLVKYGDRDYEVTAEDWVSLAPISSATVRKIGFGRITEVSVATTSTGTYSSDGMVSPYIRYPGISVRQVPLENAEADVLWRPVPGTHIYTLGSIPSPVRIIEIE